ncbi:MAG: hypothetical protein ACRD04_06165 [Terriglobales bacterium]
MRCSLIVAAGLVLSLGLLAQAPPKNAVDITSLPATDTSAAPSATIAAPASVIRIYISNLSGADATALQGLLTQSLFESKKVVITENQANASLILQGRVVRILPPLPSPAHTSRRHSRHHPATGLADTTDPQVIKDLQGVKITNLDALNGGADTTADAATSLGADNADLGPGALTLPPLNFEQDSPADLGTYQFRLDLQLVSPDGDLVWMSGQGDQAPPFASAGKAVQAVVPAMLAAIAGLKPSTSPQP